MGNIYAVTSGKGGVGKSTISIGLALAFAKLNNKVLLVDMDEGLRCLDVMLGIDESVVFDFGDIIKGHNFGDSIYVTKQHPNLYLIPAPNEINVITHEALSIFANKIKSIYDVIIFDFPAGIDFSLYSALPSDATFLTVALPDPVSIRDASIVSQKLEDLDFSARLVLNCFDYKLTKKQIHSNIDNIIDSSLLRLLGIIPRSEELSLLSTYHSINRHGNAIKAFIRIARRLSGEQVLLPKLKKI